MGSRKREKEGRGGEGGPSLGRSSKKY